MQSLNYARGGGVTRHPAQPTGWIRIILSGCILAATILTSIAATRAATLADVAMADVRVVDGTRLRLNGIGLRTYSILGIKIYVAGLYLERRNSNADSILHSPEKKLMHIRFLRDIDEADAKKAWRTGFANNCRPPECYVDPSAIDRFVSEVPAIHRGDETTMYFTDHSVDVRMNGRRLGDIEDPHFATTLLGTFIGPVPPTAKLKRELLGDPD